MDDRKKTNEELLKENAELRKQIAKYELEESKKNNIEKEFSHSKKMMQLILDTIPQRLFWKDRNYSYIGCNLSFAKDAGFKEPNDIMGKNDFELGWKDLAQLYRDDDRIVMETDTPKLNFEEPLTTSDGSQLWLRTSKVPLHDENGKVIGIMGTYQDITKWKQAEETLRYERNLLRTLIDNLPDAVYVKDTKCRKTISNLVDVHFMGLQSETEALGKDDFDVFPKELAEGYYADDQFVIQKGQPVINREEHLFDEKGQQHWFSTSKIPLRDEKGEIVGLVGVGRDITHSKQAEEALQRERNLLRTLIDNLPDAIYVKDAKCRKTVANIADVHNIGLQSEAEVLGKDDFDLFPKELADGFYADDQTVIQTGKPVINREEYVIDEQDQKRWLSTSKIPLRDEKDKIIGIVGIGRNITERKLAEDALKQERNLLRTLIDNLPEQINYKNEKGCYLFNNLANLRSMGIQHQEDTLKKTVFDIYSEEMAKEYYEDEIQLVRTGKPMIDKEEIVVHKDTGERRWHLTSKIPLKDEQGKVTNYISISHDITERKQTEIERERLIAELKSAIANIKMLSGLVPICAHCKKIRDDKGYWTQVEAYIQERSQTRFSHGICPDCMKKLYPNFIQKEKE